MLKEGDGFGVSLAVPLVGCGLRSDIGLIFTSCKYISLVRGYDLKRKFITRTAHSRMGCWGG